MTWNEIIYATGDFFEWSFQFLEPMAMFNWVVIVGGFLGLGYWMKMQGDYNKKAEQEGTLK